MFWKRKKNSSDAARTPSGGSSPDSPLDAFKAIGNPASWDALTAEQLRALAFVRLASYGRTKDASEVPEIQRLYSLLLERVDATGRLRLEQSVSQFIEEGKTSTLALLPFVLADTDAGIISTATIDTAMLMRRSSGDPLTGPRHLAGQLDRPDLPEARRVAILSGLILLGDERVLPLVKGRWRQIESEEHRLQLAAAHAGAVSTLLIEFLLDWLEQTDDESDVGAIVGALARMPEIAHPGIVIRERRCFPIFDAGDEPPVSIEEQWSFEEYAQVLRPRLSPLIARESEPKVIPMILEAWHQ